MDKQTSETIDWLVSNKLSRMHKRHEQISITQGWAKVCFCSGVFSTLVTMNKITSDERDGLVDSVMCIHYDDNKYGYDLQH